jgi:putative ATP-dependent endonuclease of the OLD family
MQNFRSFKDRTISLGDYNCLLGCNGTGKSTILHALNVFFRNSRSSSLNVLELSEEDFHCRDVSSPIKITVTFGDLSESAKHELKDYVRQDQLVVAAVAEWVPASRSAPVIQRGLRLAMAQFAPFFEAAGDGRPVTELKDIYITIRKDTPDLPAPGAKNAMADSLRAYERDHPDRCELIESEDSFYGVSKGVHKLAPFVQWIFVPAVKDATSEEIEAKDTALGLLIARAVSSKAEFLERIKQLRERTNAEYGAILEENQAALDSLSGSLKQRLGKWAHPDVEMVVKWDNEPDKSVRVDAPFARALAGECGFLGELTRLGHGLQRSYILAVLEELAASDAAEAPRLLLGIEEPELYQHPPQAQHLADVLQRLGEANAQVIVCTHSPYFVVGKGFEDVRLVRKVQGSPEARISQTTFAALAQYLSATLGEPRYKQPEGIQAKIHQVLQPALREMFFAPVLMLVEGLEDLAYVIAALHLSGFWESWRKSGGHIVPVNGKGELIQPLAIAQLLQIPVFVMFDADGDETKPERQIMHKKDNERLLKLLGRSDIDSFPQSIVWGEHLVVWPSNLGDAVKADYEESEWLAWKSETEQELGQPGGLEKNSMFIAALLTKAWKALKPSPTLEKLCSHILGFAQ